MIFRTATNLGFPAYWSSTKTGLDSSQIRKHMPHVRHANSSFDFNGSTLVFKILA